MPTVSIINISFIFRVLGTYSFQLPILLIRDLYLIKKLGVKEFDHFTDHRIFIDENADTLFGNNLFALKGKLLKMLFNTINKNIVLHF